MSTSKTSSAKKESKLVICEYDYDKLLPLIENSKSSMAEALDVELSRAEVVPDSAIPADAVTMSSIVTFTDLDSGEKNTISLVYPGEANVNEMKISILSPVGSALIGLRIGGTIDWPLPGNKVRRLEVIAVEQPGERI